MKEKLLLLCTCTCIEIMTAIGVTGYLLILNKLELALISGVIFVPLVLFHYVMDRTARKNMAKSCRIKN